MGVETGPPTPAQNPQVFKHGFLWGNISVFYLFTFLYYKLWKIVLFSGLWFSTAAGAQGRWAKVPAAQPARGLPCPGEEAAPTLPKPGGRVGPSCQITRLSLHFSPHHGPRRRRPRGRAGSADPAPASAGSLVWPGPTEDAWLPLPRGQPGRPLYHSARCPKARPRGRAAPAASRMSAEGWRESAVQTTGQPPPALVLPRTDCPTSEFESHYCVLEPYGYCSTKFHVCLFVP